MIITRKAFLQSSLSLLCLSVTLPGTLPAQETSNSKPVPAAVQKGIAFLKANQSEDGTWTSATSLGITAIATHSLLVNGVPADDPAVARGLKFLISHQQPDGGIYHPQSFHKNYESALSILALTSANGDGRYQPVIDKTIAYLKEIQWDEKETESDRSHPAFGGAGYGSHSRPDLSNTTFFLEAMQAAGVSPHDPAVQNALVFVSRCQNLATEQNTTPHAGLIQDGGFYYTAAAGGASQAGKTPEGGLRSYASMTYAGLKSMIYAGVGADDPRVVAAKEWIRKFYSLSENPGMGQQGLFYYYQTFAKTLDALGSDEFVDAASVSHHWRKELTEKLLSLQKPNGSWVNEQNRWLEGDPNLVTAYALITLARCQQQK